MRVIAMVSTAAVALAAAPAAARDGAWYVGGDFGAMIVEDVDIGIGTSEGVIDDGVVLDHDYGFDGALFVGYDLGAFRLESEVAYKEAGLGEFENSIPIPSTSGDHPVGIHEGFGSSAALSFMMNGMLDFADDDGISGFVGGGVGIARVDMNAIRAFDDTGEFLDDGDTKVAWQIVAGLRHAISDNADVTVRYRYFAVSDLDLAMYADEVAHSAFRSHSLLGGLTFNFGAPE